jgi:hypothetical protein
MHAELAARELPKLTLEDPPRLVALYAEAGSSKAERAAFALAPPSSERTTGARSR